MPEFEIRGEADLFQAIEMVEAGTWPGDQDVRFVDWPRYEITIRGEDFDGGVPTRIMPGLLGLQRAINRGYARSVHGDVRRLTKKEEKQVELIVRLEPGSTRFFSELAQALNNALVAAAKNMSGTESAIVILGSVLGSVAIIAGAFVWKTRLNARARLHEIDHQTKLSEQETRRHEITARLVERYPNVAAQLADVGAAQDALLKRLEPKDQLMIGEEEIVNGEIGKRLAQSPRTPRVQDRLDADFIILSVDSGQVRDGFRVRVRGVTSGEELAVSIPEGTLPPDQISDLQNGEWGKVPLHMRINVARAGNRIVEATLVSAGLSPTDTGNQ